MSDMTILDGSIGQELVRRFGDLNKPLWGIGVMADNPEIVRAVHADYFAAGADVATTNTYNIHKDRFIRDGVPDQFEKLNRLGCRLAAEARDAYGAGLVAGSLGPLGGSYRPDRGNDVDEAAETFAEVARGQADIVDLYLIETMSSLDAARGAYLGAKSVGKPVWLAYSVDDDDGSRLRSGESVADAVALANELAFDALLINCSRPEAVTTAFKHMGAATMPTGAYANGFTRITDAFKSDNPLITDLNERQDLGPDAYADFAGLWAADGGTIIGGCCEVGPAHIAELTRRFKPAIAA
ncbi:MAG: homocysteine S-methyltransferase family protein [Pseudomonadota bacterium]